jgi:hypothetical protein
MEALYEVANTPYTYVQVCSERSGSDWVNMTWACYITTESGGDLEPKLFSCYGQPSMEQAVVKAHQNWKNGIEAKVEQVQIG